MRAWRHGLVTLIASLALAAPAEAAVRQGSATDPAGDSPYGAGFDITAVSVRADDSGAATVTVQTRAAPSADVVMFAGLGTQTQLAGFPNCLSPGAVFRALPAAGQVSLDGTGWGHTAPAQMEVDGNTVTLSAQDPGLAVPYDCATVSTKRVDPLNPDTGLADTLGAMIDLADGDAQQPAPTVSPQPPTTTPPAVVLKPARLSVKLAGVPSSIRRNRTIRLELKIANTGSERSGPVTVAFARARGLSGVGRARKLSALGPAQRRTLHVNVKLTKRARAATKLEVTARAGRLKATSSRWLRIGRRLPART
jgi:hypothetical protein